MEKTSRPIAARIISSFALLLAATSMFAARDGSQELDSLYVGHHWFQLRDASASPKMPDLYRGAVAAAFNLPDAEKLLERAIDTGPSDDASRAREFLIHVYMRSGIYSEAVRRMKEQITSSVGQPPSKSDKAMFAVLSQLPDQAVVSRGTSTLHYEMRDASLSIPISVNEKPGNFLLDSDSNMSVISESEASRLGMAITQGDISVAGVTGNAGSGARMAVAKNVVVGKFHLSNVAFLPLRDDQEPFVAWPAGTRGILGLPVMLAFETLRWNHDGKIEIGFPHAAKNTERANICFDNDDPTTQIEFNGRKLEFILDTGGTDSELWLPFAKEFADLLHQSGKKDSATKTGFTGSEDVATITLPELRLQVGGLATILRPAEAS
jgi:predicted aspartyl protease